MKKKMVDVSIQGDDTLRHVFEYDGITIDHVGASMSTHLRYKYPKFRSQEER